jgi:hypothetical protein
MTLTRLAAELAPELRALLGIVEDTEFTRPCFRCHACGHVGPIAWQYRTPHARWCHRCAPPTAVRSTELELDREPVVYPLVELARVATWKP